MQSLSGLLSTSGPTQVTVGVEQPSVAVTSAVLGAGVASLQFNVNVGGQVMTGTVTSVTLNNVCTQVIELPQPSVAFQVLKVVSVQLTVFVDSVYDFTI